MLITISDCSLGSARDHHASEWLNMSNESHGQERAEIQQKANSALGGFNSICPSAFNGQSPTDSSDATSSSFGPQQS